MNASKLLLLALLTLWVVGCGKTETPPAPGATEHAAEEAHEENVKLSPEQIEEAGIGVAQAGPATIRERLPLYGVIAPNAERMREAGARFPGVIRSVNKRIGDAVEQGEVLATVESNESLQTYSVVAPLAGVITARRANPGEQTGDKPLFTVADLSTVWVELSLFPRDLAKVHVGQSVRVKSGDTNMSAEGKVVYVAPFGSSSNQTLTARVLLDNSARKWAPGLYVTAEVTLSSAAVPVAVANDALQTFEGKTVVFAQHQDIVWVEADRPAAFDPLTGEQVGAARAGHHFDRLGVVIEQEQ